MTRLAEGGTNEIPGELGLRKGADGVDRISLDALRDQA
jgi:hypothetical protein